MSVNLTFSDNETVCIKYVVSIRMVSITGYEVTCFGNSPVVHRNVKSVTVVSEVSFS
jgi:hypothetical protein